MLSWRTPDTIRIPRLTTPGAVALVVGTLVLALGVAGYLMATQPPNAPYGDGVAFIVAAAVLVVWRSGTWLDPVAGTVTWRRWAVLRTTLALRDTTSAEVVGSGSQALLRVRGERTGGHVLLLVLSDHVQRSQSPELLTTIADALEAHTTRRTSGTAVGLLRAQAAHMATEADPTTSPLASSTRLGMLSAAGSTGAVGGGIEILD